MYFFLRREFIASKTSHSPPNNPAEDVKYGSSEYYVIGQAMSTRRCSKSWSRTHCLQNTVEDEYWRPLRLSKHASMFKSNGPRVTFLVFFFSVQLRSFMLLSIIVDFLPHKPEFDPKAFHVRFMMETVAVGQVFLSTSVFPCQLSFHQSSVIVHLSSISGIMGLLVAIVPRRSVLLRIRNETK
jgi:hypothetical protein